MIAILLVIVSYHFTWECYSFNIIMATTGYETRNKVACVKCKQRYKPPVGTSCERVKAVKPKQQSHKGTMSGLATDSVGVVMDGSQPGPSTQGLHKSQGESSTQTTHKPTKKAK